MFRRTLYFKIMIVFSAILVTLFMLTFLLFNISTRTIAEKNIESIDNQTRHAFLSFSNDMLRIQNVVQSFGYDQDVISLAYSSRYQDVRQRNSTLNSLSAKTNLAANLSQYIRLVRFNMPGIDRTITAGQTQVVNPLDKSRYTMLLEHIRTTGDNLYLENGEITFLFYNLTGDSFREVDQYIIEVALDRGRLMELLDAQSTYGGSVCLLMDANNGRVVLHNGAEDGPPPAAFPMGESAGPEISGGLATFRYSAAARFPQLQMVLRVPVRSVEGAPGLFAALFLLFVIAAVAFAALYIIYCYRLIRRPFKEIIAATYQVEKGDFGIRLQNYGNSELAILAGRFQVMTEKLSTLIEQVYLQEVLVRQAELRQLQSQINPHFLYNSFFILSRMIQSEENRQAARLLGHLSRYFQYITRDDAMTVTLDKEIGHITEYAEIQQIRFQGRVAFSAQPLPMSYTAIDTPRLILQPVVENYFKYARPTAARPQMLRVYYEERGDKLSVCFEDNLCHMEEEALARLNTALSGGEDAETTGLVNVSKRLRLMYGDGCGVALKNLPENGLRTEVTIQTKKEG